MLGDREIKGAFWIRNRLGIAKQEREIEVVLCRARQSGLHLHWHRTVLDLLEPGGVEGIAGLHVARTHAVLEPANPLLGCAVGE